MQRLLARIMHYQQGVIESSYFPELFCPIKDCGLETRGVSSSLFRSLC